MAERVNGDVTITVKDLDIDQLIMAMEDCNQAPEILDFDTFRFHSIADARRFTDACQKIRKVEVTNGSEV